MKGTTVELEAGHLSVVLSPEAEQDRADILDYVAADNPQAAVRMDELFSEAADRLGNFPMLGHIARVPGTRDLIPHESYRLVYEVEADTVWILALVHTARPDGRPARPAVFWGPARSPTASSRWPG
jgi:toxin ParE1/3/4